MSGCAFQVTKMKSANLIFSSNRLVFKKCQLLSLNPLNKFLQKLLWYISSFYHFWKDLLNQVVHIRPHTDTCSNTVTPDSKVTKVVIGLIRVAQNPVGEVTVVMSVCCHVAIVTQNRKTHSSTFYVFYLCFCSLCRSHTGDGKAWGQMPEIWTTKWWRYEIQTFILLIV